MSLLFVLWTALWAYARWVWKPPPPPRMQKIWVFEYRDRGKPMQFLVAEPTEAKAVIKYLKAGLNPAKITASYSSEVPE